MVNHGTQMRLVPTKVSPTCQVPLPLRRSDASYRLRGGDRIGRYCDLSGSVPIHWGEAR